VARPTKNQQLINKIEKYKFEMSETAANNMRTLFERVLAIAVDPTATHASQLSAIKLTFEIADRFLKEEDAKESLQSSPEAISQDFFSTTYKENSKTH